MTEGHPMIGMRHCLEDSAGPIMGLHAPLRAFTPSCEPKNGDVAD